MGYAYSPDALIYDSGTGTWRLRPDYDHTMHRVDIQITDDDAYFDGDWTNGEVGDDANQLGSVYDMAGNPIASGQIYDEEYYELSGPGGETIWVERVEIGGQHVGYIVTAPLEEGVTYTQTGGGNVGTASDTGGTDTRITYSEMYSVQCFGPGTMILTAEGEVPVEWLAVGDRVVTRDHGLQPIRWIGRQGVAPSHARREAGIRPVHISPGAIAPGAPSHDLILSGNHRVLLRDAMAELYFGSAEVLVPAKALIDGNAVLPGRDRGGLVYTHLLFERHEIIQAEGLWVESLLTNARALDRLPQALRHEVLAALGDKAHRMQAARICLKPREVALLRPQVRDVAKARRRRNHVA